MSSENEDEALFQVEEAVIPKSGTFLEFLLKEVLPEDRPIVMRAYESQFAGQIESPAVQTAIYHALCTKNVISEIRKSQKAGTLSLSKDQIKELSDNIAAGSPQIRSILELSDNSSKILSRLEAMKTDKGISLFQGVVIFLLGSLFIMVALVLFILVKQGLLHL